VKRGGDSLSPWTLPSGCFLAIGGGFVYVAGPDEDLSGWIWFGGA